MLSVVLALMEEAFFDLALALQDLGKSFLFLDDPALLNHVGQTLEAGILVALKEKGVQHLDIIQHVHDNTKLIPKDIPIHAAIKAELDNVA